MSHKINMATSGGITSVSEAGARQSVSRGRKPIRPGADTIRVSASGVLLLRARPLQDPARARLGDAAVVHDQLAVHGHVGNALAVVRGVGVGGPLPDP